MEMSPKYTKQVAPLSNSQHKMKYSIEAILKILLAVSASAGDSVEFLESARGATSSSESIGGNRGRFVKDLGGKKFTLARLNELANEVDQLDRLEAVQVFQYLEDSDPKIRIIAFLILNKQLQIYDTWNVPTEIILKSNSEQSKDRHKLMERVAAGVVEIRHEKPKK